VLHHGLTAFSPAPPSAAPLSTPIQDTSRPLRLQVAAAAPLTLKALAPPTRAAPAPPPVELEFFTAAGALAAHASFGPGATIGAAPSAAQAAAQVRAWVDECGRWHPRCGAAGGAALPSRVLNVARRRPALEMPAEEAGRRRAAPYVALSHRWGTMTEGGTAPLTTTRATVQRRVEGIALALLPQTFRDAVAVTRELGIEYLWIDSLCIVQDDEEDWAREASRLGEIFEGAVVVLSATAAEDGSVGCFGSRGETRDVQVVTAADVPGLKGEVSVRKRRGSEEHAWLSAADLNENEKAKAPTLSRGWCFQERLLASRVVHFAADELVFECKSKCRCECGGVDQLGMKAMYLPLVQRPELQQATGPEQAVVSLQDKLSALALGLGKQKWRMLVEHYSSRNFTHLRDVLPALSALAQRYRGALDRKDVYLAGIWKSRLPWDLLWYSTRSDECFRPAEEEYRGSSISSLLNSGGRIYTAPTFSWASRVGHVSWISLSNESNITVEICSAQCFPRSEDPFGEVEDGFVRLRGPLISFPAGKSDHLGSLLVSQAQTNGRIYFDTRESEGIASRSAVHLLCILKGEPHTLYQPVREATVLLLRQSNSKPGCYRRIGLIAGCDGSIFDNAPREEATIV